MAEKVDVKHLLEGPDEFITFSDRLVKWGQDHMKLVIAIAIGFVILICLIVGLNAYLDYRSEEAAKSISAGYQSYMQVVAGQAQDDTMSKALDELNKSVQEYGATNAGITGRLALGNLLLEKGDWAKAEEAFAELCEESDLAPILVPLAWHGLGKAREGEKKFDQAAEAYATAAQQSGKSLRCLFNYDRARVLALAGKKDQAAELYRQMIKDCPDDPNLERAKEALVGMNLDPAS